MKPYFQRDGQTIILGDCREVLPTLPHGIVVTDPPYNVGYHYGQYDDNLPEEEYWNLLGAMCRVPSVVLHYPEQLCRLSWMVEEIPSRIVAWVYSSNTPRQWRGISWFGITPDFALDGQPYKNPDDRRVKALIEQGRVARLYDWWYIEQVKNVSEDKTRHPCQIPLSVMKRVLRITPSGLVIDPFMGSGTTLLAAKELGREAVGIELDEAYAEIAARRLEQSVLDFAATGALVKPKNRKDEAW